MLSFQHLLRWLLGSILASRNPLSHLYKLSKLLWDLAYHLSVSTVAFKPLVVTTAVAIASQSDQSSGCPSGTSFRYCSTHWFFCSESPSVWGWEAVDKFCWIPNCLVSAFPKCEVNLGSLSLMIFLGSPYYRLMWLRYSCAIPTPEMWVEHGRNSATLEHPWSMIVRMASSPFCVGRPIIKSMAIT